MKHPKRIEDYLEHIVEASTRAVDYLRGIESLEAFGNDVRTQDAILRNIEIIGEAVSKIQKVDPDFTTAHPEIPWDAMRAMRNIVMHEYFAVDRQVVWDTVKSDLPALLEKIKPLLTRDPEPPGP